MLVVGTGGCAGLSLNEQAFTLWHNIIEKNVLVFSHP